MTSIHPDISSVSPTPASCASSPALGTRLVMRKWPIRPMRARTNSLLQDAPRVSHRHADVVTVLVPGASVLALTVASARSSFLTGDRAEMGRL